VKGINVLPRECKQCVWLIELGHDTSRLGAAATVLSVAASHYTRLRRFGRSGLPNKITVNSSPTAFYLQALVNIRIPVFQLMIDEMCKDQGTR